MKATLVVLALVAATTSARAEQLADVVRAKLVVPAGIGVVTVHVAPQDVAPETVALEAPAEIRAGRTSVRVYVKGKSTWVPVTFGTIARVAIAAHPLAAGHVIEADDVTVAERAGDRGASPDDLVGSTVVHAIAADTIVNSRDVALPAPLARGTTVEVEVRRGAIRVHGTGTLELAAHPGRPASVRLAGTRQVVHGTLLASHVVVVKDAP